MRSPFYSGQFERDVKRLQRRGKNMGKLKTLIELLLSEQQLPAKYKDHPLKHNWAGYRDAHVEPDWVLIYTVSEAAVRFERTGTHEELFDKL
jgi:mRNA interferase YafQ